MSYAKNSFECRRGDLTIRGKAFVPNLEGPLPALIISHGFMDNQKGGPAPFVETGVDAGYAVFTFDYCGGCLRGTSDGATTDMSVLTEIEDLQAVIAHVKSLSYVDPERISLMGQSQGGFVSAIVAARREDIASLILFYPALCIPDDARRGSMMMAKFDPKDVPETFFCGPMKLGRRYPTDVMEMDPLEEIKGYKGRVLLIHGTEDRIVNVRYARQAEKTYNEAQAGRLSAAFIEGADHGFKGDSERLAKDLMTQFLAGRDLILHIDVTLTDHLLEVNGLDTTLTLPFTGFASSPWFEGKIQPGAADVQRRHAGKIVRLCADYEIFGKDCAGKECMVHVVNVDEGSGWKPTVETESEALSFLNGDCYTVFEGRKQGPVIRIFTRR